MNITERVSVSIYCKIYTDTFSNEMINRKATGNEIFDFLMKDAEHCFDDTDQIIPGDCNIWYLGCNEKFGFLKYGDKEFQWSFGESSFDRVEKFITLIYNDGLFTEQQYQILMEKIQEGRGIDNMYLIKEYLICKNDDRKWIRSGEPTEFRSEIKSIVSGTQEAIKKMGYKILS